MTPLEDRVRDAIRARAAEVPPDAVPPLRLPAPPVLLLSPARWPGESRRTGGADPGRAGLGHAPRRRSRGSGGPGGGRSR